ncbi:MAG: hypothetical protein OJI67_01015 [Prosthecobacter sp.]|nr:hypothetical protein [Prosthecobacter sp.]
MIPETVDTVVTIQTPHSDRTWHAALPNGRLVLAFRPEEVEPIELEVGTQVPARLTVYDFSRALLLV